MRCEVYEIGRVAAGPGALRLLAQFSERELAELIWVITVINAWTRLGATARPWALT